MYFNREYFKRFDQSNCNFFNNDFKPLNLDNSKINNVFNFSGEIVIAHTNEYAIIANKYNIQRDHTVFTLCKKTPCEILDKYDYIWINTYQDGCKKQSFQEIIENFTDKLSVEQIVKLYDFISSNSCFNCYDLKYQLKNINDLKTIAEIINYIPSYDTNLFFIVEQGKIINIDYSEYEYSEFKDTFHGKNLISFIHSYNSDCVITSCDFEYNPYSTSNDKLLNSNFYMYSPDLKTIYQLSKDEYYKSVYDQY